MSRRSGVRNNNRTRSKNNNRGSRKNRRNATKASLKRNNRRVRSRQANIQLDKYKKENEFLNEFYESQQSVMQQWHHTIRGGQALKAILIARKELRKGNFLTASIFFVLATSIAGIYSPEMKTTTGFHGQETSRLPVANMNTLLEYHYGGLIPKVRNDSTYKKFIQEEELQEEQQRRCPPNLPNCNILGGGRRTRRRRRKKRGAGTKFSKSNKYQRLEQDYNFEERIKNVAEHMEVNSDIIKEIYSKKPFIKDDGSVDEEKIDESLTEYENNLGIQRQQQQQQQQGGKKSKKVKEMIKVFQKFPDIFPSGYFRFLGARLDNHINKKTIIFKHGVILTWIQYQKTVKKSEECVYKPGDVKLDQIVNKNPGNGKAKKIMLKFLRDNRKKTIWLEVKEDNKRAIAFYEKNGFEEICNTKFGDIKGIIMKKNP